MKIKNILLAMVVLFLAPGFPEIAAANGIGHAVTMTLTAAPSAINDVPLKEMAANMTKEQKEARMAAMKERVKEIKAMDKSQLTREQRKALRTELKNMNAEARSYGHPGVYISVGALIVIILLLIIILH